MAEYDDPRRYERFRNDERRGRERDRDTDFPWGSPDYDRDDFRGLYEGRREGHGWHHHDRDWQDDRARRGVYGQGPSFARGFDRPAERGWDRDRDRGGRGWMEKAGDEVASWFGDDDAERRRNQDAVEAGQHRGRGPRGYRRSDERVLEDCNDRLTDDPWLDASDIDVRVQDGEVTLTGTVDNRAAKRRAEDVVDLVSGVRNVQNNLRLRDQSVRDTSGTATGGLTGGPGTGGGGMTPV